MGQLLRADPVAALSLAENDHSPVNRLYPIAFKISLPLVGQGRLSFRRGHVIAIFLYANHGVIRSRLHIIDQHPDIAAEAFEAFLQPVLPSLALDLNPLGQHLAVAVFIEVFGRLTNQPPAEVIELHAVVTVYAADRRGDEKGRIREYQIEALARHGFESVTLAKFHIGHAVQGGIEHAELACARVQIRGDHTTAVRCRRQSQNSIACAEVERAADAGLNRQVITDQRSGVGPEDRIRSQGSSSRDGVIGKDQVFGKRGNTRGRHQAAVFRG